MQAQITGNTVDECIVKCIERLQRDHDIVSKTPVSIRLENPLARFSFLPTVNPLAGVVYGVCALAGVNDDPALNMSILPKAFTKAFKETMQGPCLRAYKPGAKTLISLRTAIGSIGSNVSSGKIDQLQTAIEQLKTKKSATIILHDSARGTDSDFDMPLVITMTVGIDNSGDEELAMTVYIPTMEISKMASYVVPVFTFIQQVVAIILGLKMESFTIITESLYYKGDGCMTVEDLEDMKSFLKSLGKVPSCSTNIYKDSVQFDLRYIDNALRYMGEFMERVMGGDLLVGNPFPAGRHLQVFFDYAEVFRASEAIRQEIEVDGASTFIHPHLAYYYDL